MRIKINLLLILLTLGMINNSYSQEKIDLFIWAGQSNAQGYQGNATYYPTDPDSLDSKIKLNYTFIGNSRSDGWVTMQPQTGRFPLGHFGPEVSFARKLAQTGFNPAIFKYTRGGSSIWNDWLAPGENGFYDDMITDLVASIGELESLGHTVTVRGFIWIQGESDAEKLEYARAFEASLLTYINDIRIVAGNTTLPIILGVDEQHMWVVHQPEVLQAHYNIAKNDDNIIFTSMYGLPKADNTHLTPVGLITHGEQIFATYLQIK